MTGTDLIDLSKIFLIAGVSILIGVFVGSRNGGEYIFEIGRNLLIGIIFTLTFAFCFSTGLFYLETLKLKLNKNE